MQAVKGLTGSARLSAPAASLIPAQAPVRRAPIDTFGRVPGALNAPPSYNANGRNVVFADIQRVDSDVVLDVKARRCTVKSKPRSSSR